MRTKLMVVVGARPNFMKAAPLMRQLQNNQDKFEITFVHTGQHYDEKMSKLFFDDLHLLLYFLTYQYFDFFLFL